MAEHCYNAVQTKEMVTSIRCKFKSAIVVLTMLKYREQGGGRGGGGGGVEFVESTSFYVTKWILRTF